MYPLQPPAQEQQGRPTPELRERKPPVPPVRGLGPEPVQAPAGWKMFQAILKTLALLERPEPVQGLRREPEGRPGRE